MKAFKLLALTSCVLLAAGNGVAQQNYSKSEGLLQYVDPYIGSGYHGHVFVGTSVPYGMVQLGPTNIHKGWDWCSGYHYSDSILIGFSHTHLSGTGCTDLCDILIMPLNEIRTPRGNQDDIRDGYASRYSHANEIARPEYYSLLLDRYNIKAELTATDRVGFHRYTYPEGKPASILIDLREGNGSNAYDSYIRKVDDYTVEGYRYVRGWSPSRKVYFVLKSDKKIEQFTAYDDNAPQPWDQLKVASVKSVLTFGNVKEVKIKVALSSVSCDNAAMNLQSELTHWDFDKVVDMSADRWNKQLEKMTVETDDEASKRVFYTAHYHTMIAPTLFCDVNGEYRGMNDMIYTDPKKANYTTLSLWDTYRASHPLFTYTEPERAKDMIKGFLKFYEQNGALPLWNLYGWETNMMIGYHAVPVIVDAYLKGIGDFNAEKALEACIATANRDDYRGIGDYKKLGYVPAYSDPKKWENWSLSKTLEYAYDDYCIAKMAEKMGKKEIADEFFKRSQNYHNVYNPATSFMQPRDEEGNFAANFSPDDYTEDICESNGWQYFWSVPQDLDGLIGLVGSKERFAEKLDSMFTYVPKSDEELPIFSTGMIGQYAHGNEPSHHVIYLYNKVGQPWKTQKYVAQVLHDLYLNAPDGICGNEDCGQMSAWFVFSAMGFYPVDPISGQYEIGSPLFPEVKMHVGNGKIFTVLAPEVSAENIYIQSVKLNGQPYDKSYITHEQIMSGATLEFVMGSQPGPVWYTNE